MRLRTRLSLDFLHGPEQRRRSRRPLSSSARSRSSSGGAARSAPRSCGASSRTSSTTSRASAPSTASSASVKAPRSPRSRRPRMCAAPSACPRRRRGSLWSAATASTSATRPSLSSAAACARARCGCTASTSSAASTTAARRRSRSRRGVPGGARVHYHDSGHAAGGARRRRAAAGGRGRVFSGGGRRYASERMPVHWSRVRMVPRGCHVLECSHRTGSPNLHQRSPLARVCRPARRSQPRAFNYVRLQPRRSARGAVGTCTAPWRSPSHAPRSCLYVWFGTVSMLAGIFGVIGGAMVWRCAPVCRQEQTPGVAPMQASRLSSSAPPRTSSS